jgi:hypothetical protein
MKKHVHTVILYVCVFGLLCRDLYADKRRAERIDRVQDGVATAQKRADDAHELFGSSYNALVQTTMKNTAWLLKLDDQVVKLENAVNAHTEARPGPP